MTTVDQCYDQTARYGVVQRWRSSGEHPIDEALTNLGESYVDENGQPHPYGAYASLTCADKPEIKG